MLSLIQRSGAAQTLKVVSVQAGLAKAMRVARLDTSL